jgi:hypothetical protein
MLDTRHGRVRRAALRRTRSLVAGPFAEVKWAGTDALLRQPLSVEEVEGILYQFLG